MTLYWWYSLSLSFKKSSCRSKKLGLTYPARFNFFFAGLPTKHASQTHRQSQTQCARFQFTKNVCDEMFLPLFNFQA